MSAQSGFLTGPVLPAILCIALGVALYEQLSLPPDQPAGPDLGSPVGDLAEVTVADPFVLPPVAAFSEIVERPVFSPNRRLPSDFEPKSETVDIVPNQPGALDLEVVGITIDGPRKLALLRAASGGRMHPMAEGDELSGWTLVAIEPFRLVFRRDGDEQTFEIEYRDQ